MTPEQWIERYRRAWETADAGEIVDLFTPDASYRSGVFRKPHIGSDAIRQYWQDAAGTQREVAAAPPAPTGPDVTIPPPSQSRDDVPASLDDLILSMLAEDPAARPASADAVLAALRKIEPTADLETLIANGENATAEFKQTMRWDIKASKTSAEVLKMAVKAVCSFLNGDGGTLLIGVSDTGELARRRHRRPHQALPRWFRARLQAGPGQRAGSRRRSSGHAVLPDRARRADLPDRGQASADARLPRRQGRAAGVPRPERQRLARPGRERRL